MVIADQGDGWWAAPDSVACDVCWNRRGKLPGFAGRYWLLRLSNPMHEPSVIATFEYVLVMHTGHNLAAGGPFEDWSTPMYPVLRRVEPGEHVSFDGELVAGVKASIVRASRGSCWSH